MLNTNPFSQRSSPPTTTSHLSFVCLPTHHTCIALPNNLIPNRVYDVICTNTFLIPALPHIYSHIHTIYISSSIPSMVTRHILFHFHFANIIFIIPRPMRLHSAYDPINTQCLLLFLVIYMLFVLVQMLSVNPK